MDEIQIRCFCRRTPLLAVYSPVGQGVEVKQVRSGGMRTRVVVKQGVMYVQCRECLRWTRILVRPGNVKQDKASTPKGFEN